MIVSFVLCFHLVSPGFFTVYDGDGGGGRSDGYVTLHSTL